jgi:hypothetical protein
VWLATFWHKGMAVLVKILHHTQFPTRNTAPPPLVALHGPPGGPTEGPGLHELLCSLLRCLLRPAMVLGLAGWAPRARVLALVQGKSWFMVGEEKGVEDKAGETRAQPCDPQQGPACCRGPKAT